MNIREAKLSDTEAIARVYVDSWKSTYKNIIPDSFLERMTYEKRIPQWINNISRANNYVYVAETNDGEIVGVADGGKRETNQFENSGDLTSIYISKEYQGQGIGKKLVERLFSKFKELGYQRIFVEVLDDNKSKFFYEKMGAEFYGLTTTEVQGKELSLVIYEWKDVNSVLMPS